MRKLEEKIISVKGIERVGESEYRVSFDNEAMGHSVVVSFPEVKEFYFDRKYKASFQVCGIPDFPGDNQVCTVSYYLTQVHNSSGKLVYQSDREIPDCY